MYRFIRIHKEQTPYSFTMDAPIIEYHFVIDYNYIEECFTVSLYRDGQALTNGEPIRYGVPLFRDVSDYRYPGFLLIPWDISGKSVHDDVTWENINNAVKIFIFETAKDINMYYSKIKEAIESTENVGQ